MENIKFVKVNYQSAVNEQLTPKIYVDNKIDEPTLIRNNQDNNFKNHNLTIINSITLNSQAVNDNEVFTKSYVDQFHDDNERNRRDLGIDFYNESSVLLKNSQDIDFNYNKSTNIDSMAVKKILIQIMNWRIKNMLTIQ